MSRSSKCGVCRESCFEHCTNMSCPIGYHANPEDQDDETPDPLEERISEAYEVGKVATMEGVAKQLAKKAGEAYAREADGEARTLRELARQYQSEAKDMRKKFDERYRPGRTT